jgi:hypothetical protein
MEDRELQRLRFSFILPGDEIVLGFIHNPRLMIVFPPDENGEEEVLQKQMLTLGFLFFRIDLIID